MSEVWNSYFNMYQKFQRPEMKNDRCSYHTNWTCTKPINPHSTQIRNQNQISTKEWEEKWKKEYPLILVISIHICRNISPGAISHGGLFFPVLNMMKGWPFSVCKSQMSKQPQNEEKQNPKKKKTYTQKSSNQNPQTQLPKMETSSLHGNENSKRGKQSFTPYQNFWSDSKRDQKKQKALATLLLWFSGSGPRGGFVEFQHSMFCINTKYVLKTLTRSPPTFHLSTQNLFFPRWDKKDLSLNNSWIMEKMVFYYFFIKFGDAYYGSASFCQPE